MKRFFLPVSLLALAAGSATAQAGPAQSDTLPGRALDTVAVRVTRAPAQRTQIPQQIVVIGRREIEQATGHELVDVLKKQASVDVIQYEGLLSGIGIRGFRPETGGPNKRTLLLIDGRPAGAYNLATVDLRGVERIEVLKGPASALYGSSAMGGAVNLITRRSTGAPTGEAWASYGSFATSDLHLRAGGAFARRFDGDLSLTRFDRGEDFRIGSGNALRDLLGSESATKLVADGSLRDAPDRGDGQTRGNTEYTYQSGSARLGVQVARGLRADARGERFRADDVETPGDIFTGGEGRKDLDRTTADLALAAEWGRFAPTLRAYTAREATDFYNLGDTIQGPFVSFGSQVRTQGVQLQNVARIGEHALTAGIDLTETGSRSRSFSGPGRDTRPFNPNADTRSMAGFAEARLSWLADRATLTAGGRFDRITLDVRETPLLPDFAARRDQFEVFNPSAGAQFTATSGIRLHATVGRAFVAPDAVSRAALALSRGAGNVANVTVGNADLSPERSVTWDAGVGFQRRTLGLDADVTMFRTEVSDRITRLRTAFPTASRPRTTAGDVVASVTTYANANEAQMHGVEWRAALDVATALGMAGSLRIFSVGTEYLRADEQVRVARVDPTRFAGRTDFRPEEAIGAITFGGDTTIAIRNVADRTVTVGAEWDDLRRFGVRLSGRYVGERQDQDFTDFSTPGDVIYPAFTTLDLVATARLNARLSASVLVDNLTDENYYEKRGYPLPGRSLRLRLRAGF